MNILVSACLLGINCRYDGTSVYYDDLSVLKEKACLIPVCPEVYGGLGIPRVPAERVDSKVVNKEGADVTNYYTRGAYEVLKIAKLFNCNYAILKERSPACGYGKIYDGTFTGRLVEGDGVLAELLKDNGIVIMGETQINDLLNSDLL